MGIFNITGKDIWKARAINTLAADTFSGIEKLRYTLAKKLQYTPLNGKNPSKEDVYGLLDCKDEEKFKRLIRRTFVQAYNEGFNNLDKLSGDKILIKKSLPLKDDPEALREAVKSQCKIRAQMEEEAYIAQDKFLQAFGAQEDMDKISPVFYSALIEALS